MRIVVCLFVVAACLQLEAAAPRWKLQQDDQAGQLTVVLDGREIVAYQYGDQFALPHYWPLRSPSGKLLTVQRPDPFPHHRSVWIADKIQVGQSPPVDFYHCWKNYKAGDDPKSGFRHFIRHQSFADLSSTGRTARVQAKLQWIIDETTPVIDEGRSLRVVALDDGEYLLDLEWELKPTREPVAFVSDAVHYAWPYVRMHPQFSGQRGGAITDDRGRRGQEATDGQTAKWIDYSNAVDGSTEGLAVFVYPDDKPHKWLTREYGTFGPRRADDRSGTNFTLAPEDSLRGRVGILIHRGDVAAGRVAERYRQYIEGTL